MPRIGLLSTSDTDLLSARSSGADYTYANPAKIDIEALAPELTGSDLVVFRVLGSAQAYANELELLRQLDRPLVVLGGEQLPDASLMQHPTVPAGIAAESHRYLAQGGPENLLQLHGFLSDTVLLTGAGFEPPTEQLSWGELPRPRSEALTLPENRREIAEKLADPGNLPTVF